MLELRKLRLEKGLTQAELAKKAGVSEISIRKYEDGSRNPKIQTLIKLADVLQVSLSELQSYQMIFLIQEKSFLIMLSMKIIRLT